ncbi:metalloregulator ArsR/SmtB family transcription factor [Polaromonas sp. SM01]|uniref:ArsR/SmtB family transcription factor n=1 Tax=Polaromonas sp. SM01 TaxID=3085630 RepID=UPI0029813020|nr:metalloregulator ArsR/SmtB family transcription factor [Polaromonas sp. SM01]MDW5442670.1 metalloregulator ArsR/SmtB family transcription factor [Polaromonas sp. SM01]
MVKYKNDDVLSAVFGALADPTRRQVLQALEQGSLSVTELAQPHGMSLPGFMKHLRVLEDAGLVARAKDGRVVSCELSAQPLQEAAVWLSRYEKFWSARLDALARFLCQEQEVHPSWKETSKAAALKKSASRSATPAPKKRVAKKPATSGLARKR